jgi:imidazolonepropionase-like amidohydrolase
MPRDARERAPGVHGKSPGALRRRTFMRAAGHAIVVSIVAALPHLQGAQRDPGVPAQEPVALVNASVVSVRDGRIIPNATVVLREGKIASIGTGAPSAGLRAIDVRGRYLVPGLIDAHTHITTLRAARTALESGVTTVRSAGVSAYVDVGLRELVRKGALPGPDVVAAGYHVRPRLAEEAFLSDPGLSAFLAGGVTTPDAIRQVVRANLARGVDWIKTTSTERAGLPETDPRKQLYTAAEVKVMVDEAAARGIPVMAHAHGEEGALAAVNAGVRSIEHGTYLSETALRLMVQKGTYLVPTYATVVDLVEPGGDYDNRDLRLRGRHMLPRLRETVQRAVKLGVRIVTGADTGYGPTSVTRVSHEVAAFVEMGMTPLEALQSATTRAAEMLNLAARTGAVEAGLDADLLVVERNPLEQVSTLDDPLLVVSNGRVVVNRLSFGRGEPGGTGSNAR